MATKMCDNINPIISKIDKIVEIADCEYSNQIPPKEYDVL